MAAYRVLGSCGATAKALTKAPPSPFGRMGRPELAALQLVPPSVLLNNPVVVAPYSVVVFCGSITRALKLRYPLGSLGRPVTTSFQVAPPSALLKRLGPTAVYKIAVFCGSIASTPKP